MPKLKTHKGAAARFHVTGTGKIMRIKGPKSHLRRNKSKRVRSQFDAKLEVNPRFRVAMRRLIPYGVTR